MPLQCISYKNFVNCGPVTPEKTVLICVPFLRHGKKLAYLVKYLRIYWTNFYNLFNNLKVLCVQMIGFYLVFRYFKGRCHGNQLNAD